MEQPSVEIIPSQDRCQMCKDFVEIKVDRANRKVTVTCHTCKKYSVFKNGKVEVDEEPLP